MSGYTAKIGQLVIEQGGGKRGVTRSFSTKPAKDLEQRLGKLFGIFEIGSTDANAEALIDLIIDEARTNYYYAKPGLETDENDMPLDRRLERSLQKVNLTISSFLESEQLSLDLDRFSVVIGVIRNQELHITQVGTAGIFLLHRLTNGNYRIVDVLEDSPAGTTVPDPLKLFSQIITGKLNSHDILVATTGNVLDYFSLDRLKNILSGQIISEALAEIKTLLEEASQRENFGLAVVELEAQAAAVAKPNPIAKMERTFDYQEAANLDSMKELIRTEEETQKFLTPSILPEVKKYLGGLRKAGETYFSKIRSTKVDSRTRMPMNRSHRPTPQPQPTRPPVPSPRISGPSPLRTLAAVVGGSLRIGLSKVRKQASSFGQHSTQTASRVPYQKIWSAILTPLKTLGRQLYRAFRRLPVKNQMILGAVIGISLIFTVSITWLRVSAGRQEQIAEFEEAISDIEAIKNESEASLIYRDEAQARRQLIAAREQLTIITTRGREQESQVASLSEEISSLLAQLRHEETITDPLLLANFQNLDQTANLGSLLVRAENALLSQNQSDFSFFSVDTESRQMSKIALQSASTIGYDWGAGINATQLLVFNAAGQAASLTTTDGQLRQLTYSPAANLNVAQIASYRDRVYLLDPTAGQIYRHTISPTSISQGSPWVTEAQAAVVNATALAVDGAIYVAAADKTIIKLELGRETGRFGNDIDPLLEGPTALWTDPGSQFLYILDQPSRRLVVLNKAGGLVQQYALPTLGNLRAMVIGEPERRAYLLNGNEVYVITLTHFAN